GLDVPFLWQEYPQAIQLSAGGITYDLWSSAGGSAKVGVGAAKTHELLLVFGDGSGKKKLIERPGRGVIAQVDAQWTAASRALPNALSPPADEKFLSGALSGFQRYL